MNFIGKERFRSGISIFIFILILILSSFTVNAQESGVPEIAPINPDFISRNIERVNELNVEVLTTDGHGLGLIPSPLDLSHLKGQHASILGAPIVGYPTSYDLRTLGKVTPVRDQGNCGSCWSFATYGSMESILLLAETWDFSENNLKNTHGFDYGHCYGGDAYMSTAYLARWSGPILEADDPYNPNSNVSPTGLTTKKHLQETLIIPDRTNSLDNDNIKQAVMTYGGLYTTMYWNDSYYNLTNKAYYYNGSNYANHAVTIVGWDDNFDRTRFSPVPPGNGAFIIKNSWGTAWGENGYFYISYYDTIVGSGNTAFNSAEATANYSNVYQYDPLGWTSSIGYTGSNTAWFSNIFTATANEQLSAVSFYTASVNSSYEIYIYTGVTSTPTNGSLIGTKTGAISLPGYHTISFNPSVTLTSGQKFSVVVKLTTPGFNYPVPIEYPFAGYSSQATAGAGQSFVSSNGIGWSDITTFFTNTNVCVKAFIRTCTDNDGDGYGNPASASCAHPELDCNDSNTNIHPGATETCNNIDDD
ncbi:MAG: hypothetical protein HZA10_11245, partial [Nitrospirae bacterium]|nr:hypothetical protein [Nitrospirota bacterium]